MTRNLLVSLLACALTAVGLVSMSAQAIADRDCGDFPSQRAAQIFFLKHGGPQQDPHRLDEDPGRDDGIACESNPAPYYRKKTLPAGQGPAGGGGKATSTLVRVHHVVDGDTVVVKLAGQRKSVRMVGIDTPEVWPTTECGGPAASRALKRWLRPNERIRLVSDPTQANKDRYGRLLRYVIDDGLDANKRQVAAGNARVYVYAGKPFKRVAPYRKAQRAAQRHDRGLWGHCR
jgi:endonuclease YncB( thermonuclease family)